MPLEELIALGKMLKMLLHYKNAIIAQHFLLERLNSSLR